jgi:hypothetical protein
MKARSLIWVGGADVPLDPHHHNISNISDNRSAKPRAFPNADRINPLAVACCCFAVAAISITEAGLGASGTMIGRVIAWAKIEPRMVEGVYCPIDPGAMSGEPKPIGWPGPQDTGEQTVVGFAHHRAETVGWTSP